MTEHIAEEIDAAPLSSVSNPLSGDCASVAKALVDLFGGEFVCLYSSKDNSDEELPAHVLVEIDGELYDGSGQLSYQDAFEIHLVLNGELTKSDYSDSYFVSEKPPGYMINTETVSTVKEQF